MNNHKHGSLGTKLTVAFSALGLGPLILMGAVALLVVSVTQRQAVATIETGLLGQKVEEIDKFIKETSGIFEIRVGYEETSIISQADQGFLLDGLLEENKFIVEVALVDLTGEERSKKSAVQDATKIQLLNIGSLSQFKEAKEGRTYFGPVYYTLRGPMMTLASPVFNKNNQVIMVLTGEIALASLQDFIVSARLGKSGYIFLVDKDGTVIASPDKNFIYTNVGPSPWIKDLLQGRAHNGLDREDERQGFFFKTNVLSAGLPIEKLGWGIVAEWPGDDAFAVVSTIQKQVLGFALATVLLVGLSGWLVGRLILRPLAVLREGAGKIGGGNFDHKIAITTRDEIEELGEVFNRMGEDLKKLEELRAIQIRAEALAESLKKEKELSESKSAFLGNASHQFRTPISVINWATELIMGESPQKKLGDMKEILPGLYENSQKLSLIVNDMLLISELGIGYHKSKLEKVDLVALLNKILENYKSVVEGKKINLNLSLPQSLEMMGESGPLGHAFQNLIDNAIGYTKEGGEISVDLTQGEKEAKFSVKDNGIGITESDKTRIFEQFFRATNSVEAKNVGTGLGLFIVKTVVDGHDGKVWFESEEKKGSTFYISLPLS